MVSAVPFGVRGHNRRQLRQRFTEAVDAREVADMEKLLSGNLKGLLPQEKVSQAKSLLGKVDAVVLEGFPDGNVVLAPGPEQGLGRGEEWSFSFNDPRVSRRPQAWVRADRERVFIVHNKDSSGITSLNGKAVDAAPLENGDRISLGDLTEMTTSKSVSGSWLRLEVTRGPDQGMQLVLVLKEADFGCRGDAALPLPSGPEKGAILSWEKGRAILRAPNEVAWPLSQEDQGNVVTMNRNGSPLLTGDRLSWGDLKLVVKTKNAETFEKEN